MGQVYNEVFARALEQRLIDFLNWLQDETVCHISDATSEQLVAAFLETDRGVDFLVDVSLQSIADAERSIDATRTGVELVLEMAKLHKQASRELTVDIAQFIAFMQERDLLSSLNLKTCDVYLSAYREMLKLQRSNVD